MTLNIVHDGTYYPTLAQYECPTARARRLYPRVSDVIGSFASAVDRLKRIQHLVKLSKCAGLSDDFIVSRVVSVRESAKC